MYNFPVWCEWLKAKTAELGASGLKVDFRANSESEPGNMQLGLIGSRAMGLIENWERGDTDCTVVAPASSEMKMVWHIWGKMVTDETFESVFEEFVAQFRRYEFTNE